MAMHLLSPSLGWLELPRLFTKPSKFLTLSGTVKVAAKSYPIDFWWSQENVVAWNEGFGFHKEWRSSERTAVRILDNDYGIIVWLPSVRDQDLGGFFPDVAVIKTSDLRFLRKYQRMKPGASRDDFFSLSQFTIERSNGPSVAPPMSKDELALKARIEKAGYTYLYGMAYRKEQWSRSKELSGLLSGLDGTVPLGKRAGSAQQVSATWRAFNEFDRFRYKDKIEPRLFGFEMRGDSWVPLPTSGVYCYRESLADRNGAIWVSYRSLRFDQQQNELLFDSVNQDLVVIWKFQLEALDQPDSMLEK